MYRGRRRQPSGTALHPRHRPQDPRHFLQQIAGSDPAALHVVIADQAGFHLPTTDARHPANLRLLPLPPYSPELNPVERFGGLLKARIANRLYPSLRRLEDHLAAAAREWTHPAKATGLIHDWLRIQTNAGAQR